MALYDIERQIKREAKERAECFEGQLNDRVSLVGIEEVRRDDEANPLSRCFLRFRYV